MELYKGRVWLNGQQVPLRTLIRGISQENVFFQNHHWKFPVCIGFFCLVFQKHPSPPSSKRPHIAAQVTGSSWAMLIGWRLLKASVRLCLGMSSGLKKNATGTLMIQKSQLTSSGQSFIISCQLAPGRLKALSGYVTSIDLDMSMVVYPTIFLTSYNFWHLRWFSRISLREAGKYYGSSVACWFILNVANLQ